MSLLNVDLAYSEALKDLIPEAKKPRRSKARKRAIYLASRGNYRGAKFFALRLGAVPEQLEAVEMLIFGYPIVPEHPNPHYRHWR